MNNWTIEMRRPSTGQREKVNVEYEMTDTWPEPIGGIWQSDKVSLTGTEFKIARLLFYNARKKNLGEMIANPKEASLKKVLNKIKREKLYREPEHSPVVNDTGKVTEQTSGLTDPGMWTNPKISELTFEEVDFETIVKNADLKVIAKIVKRKNKYCVVSEKSGRNLGCYPSKEKAKKRLQQVEMFKHMKGKK